MDTDGDRIERILTRNVDVHFFSLDEEAFLFFPIRFFSSCMFWLFGVGTQVVEYDSFFFFF